MYKNCVKRGLDFFLALMVVIIGGIPMLMLALLIRLESPGPALFRQKRIGKDGRVFEIMPTPPRSFYRNSQVMCRGMWRR